MIYRGNVNGHATCIILFNNRAFSVVGVEQSMDCPKKNLELLPNLV